MIEKVFTNNLTTPYNFKSCTTNDYRSNKPTFDASFSLSRNKFGSMYDAEEFKYKLLETKRELCEVKQENSTLRSRLRRAEREVQKGANQIDQLLDPRRSEYARRTFTEIGATMIVSLQQKNENLENELMHKDFELRDLRDHLKKLENFIENSKNQKMSSTCSKCRFFEEFQIQNEKNRLQSNINKIRQKCQNNVKIGDCQNEKFSNENFNLNLLLEEMIKTRKMVTILFQKMEKNKRSKNRVRFSKVKKLIPKPNPVLKKSNLVSKKNEKNVLEEKFFESFEKSLTVEKIPKKLTFELEKKPEPKLVPKPVPTFALKTELEKKPEPEIEIEPEPKIEVEPELEKFLDADEIPEKLEKQISASQFSSSISSDFEEENDYDDDDFDVKTEFFID